MTTDFPEAPASVTYSITSEGGFNILFTVRAEAGLELLDTMTAIEAKLLKLKYKPQIKNVFGQKKEIEFVKTPDGADMLCPQCKIGHVKIIHAKDGKTYYGCDQSKYDPITKTSTGCKYFTSEDPTKIKTDLIGHEWDDQYGEPQ
jgi:UDP-N-acetylmuramyl tripeptide synthase